MKPVSRRLLVKTFVDELIAAKTAADKTRLQQSLAAYLIETKQQKTIDMVLGDISRELLVRGHAATTVTTARPITDTQRKTIKAMVQDTTGAKTVELLEHVEPSIIGGIRLSMPGQELDASIKKRLQQLQF